MIKFPPVGIAPKSIVWEKRLQEIDGALVRYIHDNRRIPKEWFEERDEIIDYLYKGR